LATLEKFVVETTVEEEAAPYRKIVSDIISDLGMAGRIAKIKVAIRPEDSLFQLAAVVRGVLPQVILKDFAEIQKGSSEGEILITISVEKHLPRLLQMLWDRYGRDSLEQPDRWTISLFVDNPEEEIDSLKNLVVDDPRRTLKSNLADMAIRVAPEGFRVRHHSLNGNNFIFVASEDMMQKEWIDEAHTMLEELKGDDASGNST
jgi:putative methanogenesis marker protein 17